jgi:adenylate cyclase
MAGERVNRKLAAIIAADVVGYSRLMAADEAGTLAALKRHREGVFDPAVAAHNGRVVKLIGDGTIVEFASVVDAVNCALSVQRSGAPAPRAAEPAIVLRIGINLGDVIMEGACSRWRWQSSDGLHSRFSWHRFGRYGRQEAR